MQTKANSAEPTSGDSGAISLDGILDPDSVLCDVKVRSKKHALDVLSSVLSGGEKPLHKLDIFDYLVSRERLGSTAIGSAMAIPHARVEDLASLRAAFVRLAEPVDFDAPDGKPVRFLFGLLVPPGDEAMHLRLLATVASMLATDLFQQSLHDAPDADALYDILTDFDPTGDDDAPDNR